MSHAMGNNGGKERTICNTNAIKAPTKCRGNLSKLPSLPKLWLDWFSRKCSPVILDLGRKYTPYLRMGRLTLDEPKFIHKLCRFPTLDAATDVFFETRAKRDPNPSGSSLEPSLEDITRGSGEDLTRVEESLAIFLFFFFFVGNWQQASCSE